MKDLKFLIISFYYNRPNLFKKSILSLYNSTYKNWELAIVDDGSDIEGKEIVKSIFKDTSNITFYNSLDTLEHKMQRNGYQGSNMGKYAQEALELSNSDYALFLCDDDLLLVDYLEKLNKYYILNKSVYYSYSHVKIYNPKEGTPIEPFIKKEYHQNIEEPTCPFYKLDMSQISFNILEYKKEQIKFPYPLTVNIDAEVFLQMYKKWGNVPYNGIDGQYKAIYEDNLMVRAGKVLGGIQSEDYVYKINIR